MKRILIVVALVVATMLSLTATSQAVTTPPYGAWVNCVHYDQACNTKMSLFGLAFSANYGGRGNGEFTMQMPASLADGAAIAQRARDLGMSVRWNVPRSGNGGIDSYTLGFVHDAAQWAGTHGFYVADEPWSHGVSAWTVAIWSQQVADAAGPAEDRAMSHYGNNSLAMSNSAGAYVNDPNWQGGNFYPFTTGGAGTSAAGSVYGPINKLVQMAHSYGNKAFADLKMFSWADPCCSDQTPGASSDRYPSTSEFINMIECARKANAERIYFWGFDGTGGSGAASWGSTNIGSAAWHARWDPFVDAIQFVGSQPFIDPGNCNNNG